MHTINKKQATINPSIVVTLYWLVVPAIDAPDEFLVTGGALMLVFFDFETVWRRDDNKSCYHNDDNDRDTTITRIHNIMNIKILVL